LGVSVLVGGGGIHGSLAGAVGREEKAWAAIVKAVEEAGEQRALSRFTAGFYEHAVDPTGHSSAKTP